MKQTVHARMLKLLSCLVMACAILGTCMLASGSEKPAADLVVYGKIFTSENDQLAEAFAVKDGKYVYVGDRNGAGAFVENGKTEVLDYTGKGLVMPGCGTATPIICWAMPCKRSAPWWIWIPIRRSS